MISKDIFLSMGSPYLPTQKDFAEALIKTARDRGFNLLSVGYNVGSHKAPLLKITEVLNESSGAIIVAFPRIHIQNGTEKANIPLKNIGITTPWNQIEAAMAYDRKLPLLVIAEEGLKKEGLIEKGYDWFVLEVKLIPESLNSQIFSSIFEEWSKAVYSKKHQISLESTEKLSLRELLMRMSTGSVITLLAAIFGLFTLLLTVLKHFSNK